MVCVFNCRTDFSICAVLMDLQLLFYALMRIGINQKEPSCFTMGGIFPVITFELPSKQFVVVLVNVPNDGNRN